MSPLFNVPSVVKFIEIKSRMVTARGWREEEMGELLFNGYTVLVWKDEKFWRWMVVMVAFNVNVLNTT